MKERKNRVNITPKLRQEIIAEYYEVQNYSRVAKKYGVVVNTVKNIWLRRYDDPDLKRFTQKYEEIKKEANEDLLDHIKSITYSNMTFNAMNLLTKPALRAELKQRGIRNLVGLIANSADKVIAVEELELKKRTLIIREKELELKQKELELRITNPDAFHTVQIINDAPPRKDGYYATAD